MFHTIVSLARPTASGGILSLPLRMMIEECAIYLAGHRLGIRRSPEWRCPCSWQDRSCRPHCRHGTSHSRFDREPWPLPATRRSPSRDSLASAAGVVAAFARGSIRGSLLRLACPGMTSESRRIEITAESSRNDFNITVLLKKDVGNRHPFEMMEFLARIIGLIGAEGQCIA